MFSFQFLITICFPNMWSYHFFEIFFLKFLFLEIPLAIRGDNSYLEPGILFIHHHHDNTGPIHTKLQKGQVEKKQGENTVCLVG